MMRPADVALYTCGGVLGVSGALGVMLWLWLRSCEKMSERGFGVG